ncbi:MAG: DUF2254 domain-containing protein [Hyphomicrobiaceae bacterium]
MTARLRKLINDLKATFWLIPAVLVVAGIILAKASVALDTSVAFPDWLAKGAWLYDGGAAGARGLLGAVASSTITVAGTVFSITIAALTLAAGQMGPRLLLNFTRDRGNQIVLGIYLGTFVYSLLVLRSVRSEAEGAFVPHLSVSLGLALAIVCVAALVWFVDHMAGRINVDTVIALVSEELRDAIKRLTVEESQPPPPPSTFWAGAVAIPNRQFGYIQQLDDEGLAKWASENNTSIYLLNRPGTYIFPQTPIALMLPAVKGAEDALTEAIAVGDHRGTSADLEYAARQLVEVAVRALSPGINDPQTAISVLDQLGLALCEIVPRHLQTGVKRCDGRMALVVSSVDYDGLLDTMFHSIRQNASTSAPVLIRMIEVLCAVASAEREPTRLAALRRHTDLVLEDASRMIANTRDIADIRARHSLFGADALLMIASQEDVEQKT